MTRHIIIKSDKSQDTLEGYISDDDFDEIQSLFREAVSRFNSKVTKQSCVANDAINIRCPCCDSIFSMQFDVSALTTTREVVLDKFVDDPEKIKRKLMAHKV